MRTTTTLLLILILYSQAFSKQVDEATAKQVGQIFLTNCTNSASFKSGINLELAQVIKSKAYNPQAKIELPTYYYIFNVSNGDGFVIVSGENNAIPILGYSDESDFDINNIAPNTQKWLEGYKDQIRYIIQNNIPQTEKIANDWQDLISGNPLSNSLNKKGSVSPLVQTKWDQRPYYNALCPFDNQFNEATVTGCVATAMAQVMKFWNYPANGTGFHSYNHLRYGTLSANFGSTTYDWSSMPNRVTSANSAVATLMQNIGVSVDMNYNIASKGGSGAYVISSESPVQNCTEYALKTYFGYKSSLRGISQNSYTESQWLSIIKGELDAGRPMVYAGYGSGGGHAFVCDGYDNNNYLHFNWGWNGYYDGYFAVNALNPGGVGTGGGTGGFNANHQAVIGIQPPSSTKTYDFNITVSVTPSATNISYGGPFTISTNIQNTGNTVFKGTYCAAIFDQSGIFIDYVDSLIESNGLPVGYTYQSNLVFRSPGNFSILPGKNYRVYIYYRPVGGNWAQITSSNSSIYDFTTINIVNPNYIEIYAPITPTTANFVTGRSATVNLDIVNNGSNFLGILDLSLYNLDGTYAGRIEQKQNINLPYNTHFQNGLTFTTANLNVKPGTYLLALQHKHNANQNFELTGSTYYQNPVKIKVTEAPFSPDAYEANNSVTQSYNLPLTYSNNIATKTTVGSNIHVGTDYDHYKFVLPAGYNYKIKARLHDLYSSGTSQVYSIDGLVSYSTDGTTWSDAFDEIITNDIIINGGGTVYFLVSPYFTGETGTYLFDATITRTPLTSSSSEKEITAFTVPGIVGNSIINSSNATVNVTVNPLTDINALTPTISVSNFASINPASGISRNFSNPVLYTVTAQDGSTKIWTVTVTKQQTSGIEENAQSDFINIYPNPTKDLLNIDLINFSGKVQSISLFNFQGQEVLTYSDAQIEKQVNVNLNSLASGIYLLRLNTDKGIINKKIEVQE